MDPTQQWLAYFDSGQRWDIYYHPQQGDEAILSKGMAKAIALPVGGFLFGAFQGQIIQNDRFKFLHFFGNHPTPSLGISNAGIHFPEIPLIRWEDIALADFSDLRGTRNRAANGGMIPEPTEGRAHGNKQTGMTLLVRNAPLILSTMNPQFHDLIEQGPMGVTASGQQWGTISVPLDPALGAEQIVEWVYLFYMLAYRRRVQIFQSGGMTSEFTDMNMVKSVLAAN